jgi:hypothetical protein
MLALDVVVEVKRESKGETNPIAIAKAVANFEIGKRTFVPLW